MTILGVNMPGPNNIERGGRRTERVCVEAKKVFDACLKQETLEDCAVTSTQIYPKKITAPLQFISGRSTSCKGKVTNLTVERLPEKPHFGRVQCAVHIPIEINCIDSHGVECRAEACILDHEDVVMYLPEAAIIPYEVEATVSAVCPDGTFSGMEGDSAEFKVIACISIILKITMTVELLLPSFGYATIPHCQEYSQEIGDSFFELPLFPGGNEWKEE